MMSGTVEDVLALSEQQLGNGGKKYWEYFNGEGTYVDGYHTPWCVDYPRWLLAKCDVGFPWQHQFAWDYHDAPQKYIVAPQDLRPGIPITFDFDGDSTGDHAGIVVSVHDWGCVTDEGNTGTDSKVRRKQRLWSEIVCGIMPAYDEDKGHWVKSGERWWWEYPDGTWPESQWLEIDGHWYYFDAEGWMCTGWVQWQGKWYFCDRTKGSNEGQMLKSTVINDGSGWYALGASGAMLTTVKTNPDHDGTYGRLLL